MLSGSELREIQSFLLVAEELHFARAAARLGVSPSRVSQILQRFERRVGAQLVARTSRTVQLTSVGHQLYAELGPLVVALEQTLNQVRSDVEQPLTVFRLGLFAPTSGGPHLTTIAEQFEATQCGCRVRMINTSLGGPQIGWLEDGRVDMLATRLPISGATGVRIGPRLSVEPRVALVSTRDPLAGRKSLVHDELGGRRIAYPSVVDAGLAAAFWPLETPSGGRLEPVDVGDQSETSLAVARGDLIHLTVPSFAQQHYYPGIVAIPVSDLPPSVTALVWLTAQETRAHRSFAAVAASVIAAGTPGVPTRGSDGERDALEQGGAE